MNIFSPVTNYCRHIWCYTSRVALVKPYGGLGNQIKPLISALRVTNKIYTTTNNFNVIFNTYYPVVHEYKGNVIEFSDWRFVLNDNDHIDHNFSSVYLQCCPRSAQRGRSIDFEYFRIPERIRSEISKIFLSLEFSSIVNNTVEEFTKDWENRVLGVHVRSWIDDPDRRSALYNIDAFYREIDRRNSSMPIFLSTDSLEVISEFKNRYGDRVVCHPFGTPASSSHICENDSSEEVIRAFCDMICLSRAEILIGSYLSTFTECAWWFGGCKQHIVII